MTSIRDYNIIKYMNSIEGGCQMTLDGILSPYKKCKKYSLSTDVSDYLKYISEKPFYIAPSFSDVKTEKSCLLWNQSLCCCRHLEQQEKARWQNILRISLTRFIGISQK